MDGVGYWWVVVDRWAWEDERRGQCVGVGRERESDVRVFRKRCLYGCVHK